MEGNGKRSGQAHPTPSIHSMMLFLESPSALDWILLAWPRRGLHFPKSPFLWGSELGSAK